MHSFQFPFGAAWSFLPRLRPPFRRRDMRRPVVLLNHMTEMTPDHINKTNATANNCSSYCGLVICEVCSKTVLRHFDHQTSPDNNRVSLYGTHNVLEVKSRFSQ